MSLISIKMFLIFFSILYATRPPILNFKDYVVAFSFASNDYADILNFMKSNKLKYIDVNIDTNPDIKNYFEKVYKNTKSRVFYYGNPLGTFKTFKKNFKKSTDQKLEEQTHKENFKGHRWITLSTLIDEAHNVDDVCRSSGSLELSNKIIEIVTNDLLSAIKASAFLVDAKQDFINVLELFKKLIENAPKVKSFDKTNFNSKMRIKKGKEVVKELEAIGITKDIMVLYKNALYSIIKTEEAKSLINTSTLHVLESVDRIVSALHFSDCEVYGFVFYKEEGKGRYKEGYGYNFWLLDGAYVFKPFVKLVKAVVLLSGTLTPFASFSSELGHTFEHEAIAPHLIKENQLFVSCFKQGHLKQDIVGTYKSYESLSYLDQVAKIVVDTAIKVQEHGGTLLFVPSYAFQENITKRINLLKVKNCLLEPKSGDFEGVLKKYHTKIYAKEPVVLVCVYRGKASEGVDFKDSSARAVICVGIPYPSFCDPQIELKKEYNDKNKHFNGRRWYDTQAFRAVNQAVGRAIRHSEDWGIIIMLDSRYQEKRNQNQLSGWVAEHLTVFETYEEALKKLNKFLEDRKNEEKEKKSKNLLSTFK